MILLPKTRVKIRSIIAFIDSTSVRRREKEKFSCDPAKNLLQCSYPRLFVYSRCLWRHVGLLVVRRDQQAQDPPKRLPTSRYMFIHMRACQRSKPLTPPWSVICIP